MAAWSGLGNTAGQPYGGWSFYISNAQYSETDKYVAYFADTWPRLRMIANVDSSGGTTYPNNSSQSWHIWALALKEYKPSIYILCGNTGNQGSGYLPSTYDTYNTYLLQEAQWAQENGMDAFCVGNENLISYSHSSAGMTVSSLSRTSNVVTATFASDHGLTTGDYIFVTGATPSDFNVADTESAETSAQVTVVNSTTVTYPSTGSDGSATGTIKMNWSAREVVRKTKAQAALAQAVFTRGPIVYSESQGHTQPWLDLGITPGTNIDLIALNGYGTGNNEARWTSWKSEVDAFFATFGTNMILTELNVVLDSGDPKVNNFIHSNAGAEEWFDAELMRRYNYARGLGITQIYVYGAVEYNFFANTHPITDYNDAYLIGRYKPIVDRLLGRRKMHAFFGTNEST